MSLLSAINVEGRPPGTAAQKDSSVSPHWRPPFFRNARRARSTNSAAVMC
jgi:hypothetical protein